MKKKIWCIMLCVALLLTSTVTATASEMDMDTVLFQKGYPQDIIEKMSKSAKEVICSNPNLIYESGFTLGYNEKDGQLVEATNGMSPRGQISAYDLELTWTVSLDTSANDNERLILYSYKWLNLPENRWQDPMSISWNDEYFEMKSNSFYKVDKYDYTNFWNDTTGSATHSAEPGYASASDAGVTWYADLKGYQYGITIDSLYGHGQLILVKKAEPPTTQRLYGHYIHKLANVGLSVNIPYVGTFNVTAPSGSDYDERGTNRYIAF